jgi:uncharacterized protein YutE (UPF0331/DUF86 family)
MDPAFKPLAQAIGRAILGAAMVEKILLLDIAQRLANSEGMTEDLLDELKHRERHSAGKLLERLKELGVDPELAARIDAMIGLRNNLVHHFMEDPDVLEAFFDGEGFEPIVERVDALALECQEIVNELAPGAFSGTEAAFEMTAQQIAEEIRKVDLDQVTDPALREKLRAMGAVSEHFDFEEDGDG